MIPLSKQRLNINTMPFLESVIEGGWWTMGKVTEQLEREFAEYIGSRYAVAVNSCSMALWLSVKACLEGNHCPNDYIVTTPLTFCSTANAIIHNGLTPFLIDVDLNTQCLDPSRIDDAMGEDGPHRRLSRVRGVIPVHFAGRPCDMDFFEDLSARVDLFCVSDCAHAVEAEWKARKVGSYGDVACYSFNPIKNVAAPEMGMITTDYEDIAKKIMTWRCHGMDVSAFNRVSKPGSYDIVDLGYKANCTDIEAVFALHQLRDIKENWMRRQMIFQMYYEALNDFSDRGIYNGCWPDLALGRENYHALHLFQIRVGNRDKFIEEMRSRDIFCGIHYKPIHLHTYYAKRYGWKRGMFPVAEFIGDHTVSLPCGPGMSNEDVEIVIDAMESVFKEGEYLL